MAISYVDLPPLVSLKRAREDSSQGRPEAWDALDRHLRWLLVDHLQNRSSNPEELERSLIEASHWAEREQREPWRTRWPYLLELLTDAEGQPSIAVGLQAVEGRAAEMLALLVRSSQPQRPGDVSKTLGISPQQVSNLGQKLENAGLIIRRRSGRLTWMFPTPEGHQLAQMLPLVVAAEESQEEPGKGVAELALWDESSIAEEIRAA
jgi:DNA-binding transcriptional ArsR family regulator